jgi:glycosyltransferase involved in cell wall biosynthesis
MSNETCTTGAQAVVTDAGLQRFGRFLELISGQTYPEPVSELHTSITNQMLDETLSRTSLQPGSRILDVGCGQGPALDALREKGFAPTGITINDEDIRVCRAKGHDVCAMDQSFLEFPDEEFHLVWARHCIEHSVAPYFTLTGFSRVLKPGGWLYVEVPAPDTACHHERNLNHYSVLTRSAWLSLLERTGFSIVDTKSIKFQTPAGADEYWVFLCKKPSQAPLRTVGETSGTPLHLALAEGENYGWGVCSKYLSKELGARTNVAIVRADSPDGPTRTVDGDVFVAMTGIDFFPLVNVRGTRTFGYTFFENELNENSRKNAPLYDRIFCGSTWCKDKLLEAGIPHADVLLQGVDPDLFYPVEEGKNNEMFVIFSGGKFEYRKGQDLVLKAVKVLQERYQDVVLVNCWYNLWPQTMNLMRISPHIVFDVRGTTWEEIMHHLYQLNGLDERRIVTCPLMRNSELRSLYAKTNVGLFPNRCEGGTNLVLMEYMACGKPVIASYSSGHRDIVNENNALLLKNLRQNTLSDHGAAFAVWDEPSLEEIVESLDYAYHHRDAIGTLGTRAGEDMKQLMWGTTADKLLKSIQR